MRGLFEKQLCWHAGHMRYARTAVAVPNIYQDHPQRNMFGATQVEGGQDKGLPVSGKLSEARCRFAPLSVRGNPTTNPTSTTAGATATGAPSPAEDKGTATSAGINCLDFGHASVGVEITRTVMLQNIGKSPAVFFVDAADFKLVS